MVQDDCLSSILHIHIPGGMGGREEEGMPHQKYHRILLSTSCCQNLAAGGHVMTQEAVLTQVSHLWNDRSKFPITKERTDMEMWSKSLGKRQVVG